MKKKKTLNIFSLSFSLSFLCFCLFADVIIGCKQFFFVANCDRMRISSIKCTDKNEIANLINSAAQLTFHFEFYFLFGQSIAQFLLVRLAARLIQQFSFLIVAALFAFLIRVDWTQLAIFTLRYDHARFSIFYRPKKKFFLCWKFIRSSGQLMQNALVHMSRLNFHCTLLLENEKSIERRTRWSSQSAQK